MKFLAKLFGKSKPVVQGERKLIEITELFVIDVTAIVAVYREENNVVIRIGSQGIIRMPRHQLKMGLDETIRWIKEEMRRAY